MQAFIFDLDGTLFESMDVWTKVDKAFFQKRGLTLPKDYAEATLAMHMDEAAAYIIKRFGLNESVEDIKQEWLSIAQHAYENEVVLKPYAKEYLTKLSGGGYKLAVATSLPEELMTPALRKHGIYHIFHAICNAREVGCGKAKPDIFMLAAKKLGVLPGDCLLFDDILAAVKSAKGIGMNVCAVYDKSSQHHWDEMKTIADYSIKGFEEVWGLIPGAF